MKYFLYFLIAIILIAVLFFSWFFLYYLKIPELSIPENSTTETKMKVVDQWFSELQKEKKFNGGVLLVKDGIPLLMKGYGYETPDTTRPVTENTLFQLASVSKQFTAFGILVLAEKGTLNLDDLAGKYIDDFPYRGVTIRHLLNQTSGIPDIYMELAQKNKKNIRVLTNAKAAELIVLEKREAESNPGEKQQYSNTNYVLLGHIIERVSGQRFEDFFRDQVFSPLDMQHSRVWNLVSEDSDFPGKAADMEQFQTNPKEVKPSFLDGVGGDGSVYCSLSDFLKWDQYLYENPLVSSDLMQEAFKGPVLQDGKKSNYGFGWVLTKNGMWHNGAWLGARTFIQRDTIQKTCMVVLDNSTNIFMENILKELGKIELH